MSTDPTTMTSAAELAAGLTEVRHRARFSIRALSRATDIPPATLGGYFSGRHLPAMNQADVLVEVLEVLGVTDPDRTELWVEALGRARQDSRVRRAPVTSPYRGLESFGEEDGALFFGREATVSALEARLTALAGSDRVGLLAVVGPSGSGKSSLLRAGLVPRLRQGDDAAPVAVMVPGTDPFGALDIALSELAPEDPAAHGDGSSERRVLVVDQLEEIFSADLSTAARQRFVQRLVELTTPTGQAGRDVVGVLALRADYYGQAATDPDLLSVLQTEQVLLGPMSVTELTRAIVRPAESVGVVVEDGLVDVVVRDAEPRATLGGGYQAGALPLMSHALLAAWGHRKAGPLSVADYLATGGIAGAVQQTAEVTFAELGEDAQVAAQRLFGQLVNVDEDGVMTRRRVPHEELQQVDEQGRAAEDEVIEAFVTRRMLTVTDTTVELSHEALLDAWPRLRSWVAEDLDALRLRRRVASATRVWREHDGDSSTLLRGAPLALVVETLQDPASPVFPPDERRFIDASLAEENRVRDAERRRTRRLHQLLAVITVLAVVAGVVSVFALAARNDARAQERLATAARDAATSREMAITADRLRETDPALAAQLALAAYQVSPTSQARSSLLDSTATPTPTRFVGPVGTMAAVASPDGATLAVAGVDGVVRFWVYDDAVRQYRAAGQLTADDEGQPLFAAAWSPDGDWLAVGGVSAAVTVWDLADLAHPERLAELTEPKAAVQGLAWSPDGRSLAAATSDPAVFRWAVDGTVLTSQPTIRSFGGTVQAVAFRPTGDLLATASWDGRVRIWHAPATGRAALVDSLAAGAVTNYVFTVAWNPDGSLLAAGAKDQQVRLWDTADPAAVAVAGPPLTGFESWVNGVAFSPDGMLLAAGGSDGLARVWRVGDDVQAMGLPTPANVTAVQFVGDGGTLLTSEIDGVARLWPVPGPVLGGFGDNIWAVGFGAGDTLFNAAAGTADGATHLFDVADPASPRPIGEPLAAPADAGANDGAAAFAPDGSWVAAGTATGSVAFWRLLPGGSAGKVVTLPAASQLIEAAAASADSRRLAAVADDGAAVVWDVVSGSPNAIVHAHVPALPLSVALSPDGSLLAVGAADNAVYLWRVDSAGATRLGTLTGFENYVYALAFSPSGEVLAGGSTDKTVRLWDVADPERPLPVGDPIRGPGDTVYAVAWSPTGDRLIGGSTDGTVWIWDLADAAHPEVLAELAAYASDVFTVAYSSDGTRIAAGGTAHDVRFWQVDVDAAAAEVCRTAGTAISEDEWARLVPGQEYSNPCS